MSQTLKINNFSSNNILAQTRLTVAYTTPANSLAVNNSADFVANTPVAVGNLSSNTCEIVNSVSPASATTVSLATATTLPHSLYETVTALYGNVINIYRASDAAGNGQQPADTAFTLLGTVNIDPSQPMSTYTDSLGSSLYWYKYTYKNSVTSAETSVADSTAVRGSTGQNYTSIDAIKDEAGFGRNNNITPAEIDRYRQAAQTHIISNLAGIYQFPLPQPTNPIIEEITRLMAAGNLMKKQYQITNPPLAAQGDAKVGEADATLLELVDKQLQLDDANFVELVIAGANGVNSWPDDTTATADPVVDAGSDFMFRIGDSASY